jgi:hypothetical protein
VNKADAPYSEAIGGLGLAPKSEYIGYMINNFKWENFYFNWKITLRTEDKKYPLASDMNKTGLLDYSTISINSKRGTNIGNTEINKNGSIVIKRMEVGLDNDYFISSAKIDLEQSYLFAFNSIAQYTSYVKSISQKACGADDCKNKTIDLENIGKIKINLYMSNKNIYLEFKATEYLWVQDGELKFNFVYEKNMEENVALGRGAFLNKDLSFSHHPTTSKIYFTLEEMAEEPIDPTNLLIALGVLFGAAFVIGLIHILFFKHQHFERDASILLDREVKRPVSDPYETRDNITIEEELKFDYDNFQF